MDPDQLAPADRDPHCFEKRIYVVFTGQESNLVQFSKI